MKIKAVRKNTWYENQDYITLGKEYEVLYQSGGYAEFCDDVGDLVCVILKDSAHGFDFEVVQEETEGVYPDPMPIVEPEEDLMESTESSSSLDYQIKSDGGPTKYFDFQSDWVTLNDLNDYKAQYQWGPLSFHMGNVSKAIYRFGGKSGTSKVYDINKIIYSGLRMKLMLEDKQAVRKYLQQLLDDPQFQENTK